MANEPQRKPVKVGVKVGGGRPPGYKWNVEVLDLANGEAQRLLHEDQLDHLREQVRELARQTDPTHSRTIDVRPVEDFYEVRDKGGVLGGLNVRVFFCLCKRKRAIAVLGVIAKQNSGKTPLGDLVRMRVRCRRYLADHCR